MCVFHFIYHFSYESVNSRKYIIQFLHFNMIKLSINIISLLFNEGEQRYFRQLFSLPECDLDPLPQPEQER